MAYDVRRHLATRVQVQAEIFQLFIGPDTRVAWFTRESRNTPAGQSHAMLQYIFENDTLLVECLISLCLIRWVDWQSGF